MKKEKRISNWKINISLVLIILVGLISVIGLISDITIMRYTDGIFSVIAYLLGSLFSYYFVIILPMKIMLKYKHEED